MALETSPTRRAVSRLSNHLVFIALVAASVPTVSRAQRLVRLSRVDATGPNEVSIAIDPHNPERIVAVSMQRFERTDNVAYVSHDSGEHFREIRGPNLHGRIQGDDAIRFDATGQALWSYISFEGLRVERPPVSANGIFVNRSRDGGRNWETTTVVDHVNTVLPFEDKPYLTIDLEPASPTGEVSISRGRVSHVMDPRIPGPRETSDIFFAASRDSGATFSMPQRVSDIPGDAVDSDGTLEGAVPAVGPRGEVYLVWAGPNGLMFDRSDDGGLSFGEDRRLIETPGGWDLEVDGILRANGMPVTGVDRSDGDRRGTLYVNWVDARNGSLDAFVMSSPDGGESWSPPLRVREEDEPKDQFLTWMAVDPSDGSLNIVFYDRHGLSGTTTGVSLARSIDGGRRFVHYSIAPGLLDPFPTKDDVFFGDYIGVDALDGRVVVAFSHFTGERTVALSAAVFDFVPASQRLK